MPNLNETLKRARELSWERFGKRITFFLPGLFTLDGIRGEYPAVSITGNECALKCDHCQGKILDPMIFALTPEELVSKCLRLKEKGCQGVLISGGCDEKGRLPWGGFTEAIRTVKAQSGLYVSVHCGLVDDGEALRLKEAGVDQALIDVIGDDETYRAVYHVPFGVSMIDASLASLEKAGLACVPHVVCGLHYGRMRGERKAIDMIAKYGNVEQLVVVSLMKIPGVPASSGETLAAEEIAAFMAEARMRLPDVRMSLGCARQRGDAGIETLAVDAGVNRMALPSDEAIGRARAYGLEIAYQRTCCSVSRDSSTEAWG